MTPTPTRSMSPQAVACMETGDAVTRRLCEVHSNQGKQCVWATGGTEAL